MDWEANSSDPRGVVVKNALQFAGRLGIQCRFLAFALRAREGDYEFKKMLLDCVPCLDTINPIAHPPIDPLLTGLKRVRDLTSDPLVRESLSTTRKTIEDCNNSVIRLKTFKMLHDGLHTILNEFPDNLKNLLGDLSKSSTALATLEKYLDTIEMRLRDVQYACERLRDSKLETGGEDFTLQKRWIDQLSEFETKYRDGLSARNAGCLYFYIGSIEDLAKHNLGQLNSRIVTISQNLQLNELGASLLLAQDVLQKLDKQDIEILSNASLTASELHRSMKAHVIKHNEYQNTYTSIEKVFDEMNQPPLNIFEGYAISNWEEAKEKIRRVSTMPTEGHYHWRQELNRCIGDVDEAFSYLAYIFSVSSEAETVTTPQTAAENLYASLRQCRNKCFKQFYIVDVTLKEECELLNQLEKPIEELLERL